MTRGRALVRLTGSEDVNWLYVQLSRARQDIRMYAVVGPEPQGAGELDLPDKAAGCRDLARRACRQRERDAPGMACGLHQAPGSRRHGRLDLQAVKATFRAGP